MKVEVEQRPDAAAFKQVVRVFLSEQNVKALAEAPEVGRYLSRLDGDVMLQVIVQSDETHYADRPWAIWR
jgi:hypothetical protein